MLLISATALGWAAEPAGPTIVLQLQLPSSTSPEAVKGRIADLAAKGALPVTQPTVPPGSPDALHPAARELLSAAARHAPARFTWGQLATLAGFKPSGGHFNAGCKDLHALSYVAESLAW